MDEGTLPEPVDVSLRDGGRIRMRPLVREDKALLQEGFERLSPRSRYLRFFSGMPHLPERMAASFTDIDHVDHFAWAAFACDEPGEPGVGVARYIRSTDDPEVAEMAVTVVDAHQGRGIGTLLVYALAEVASLHGIRRFRGEVLTENAVMRGLLSRAHARTSASADEPGVVTADVEVEPLLGRLPI